MRRVRRSGTFGRLAEPDWADPLDTSHSRRHGGRWNAPGTFGALYLNATERMARLQVRHGLAGQPYDVEDLDPAEQHDLVEVRVSPCEALDCVSDAGLAAAGLPAGHPRETDGALVLHAACRPIGVAAREAGLSGVACRSAARDATQADEELAIFDRDVERLVRFAARRPFADWYLGEASPGWRSGGR